MSIRRTGMNKKNNGMKNGLYYVLVVLAMVMVVYFIFGNNNQQSPDIDYSTFQQQLEDGKARSERHRWSVIVGLNASVVKRLHNNRFT